MNVPGPTYALRLGRIKDERDDANALVDQQAEQIAELRRDLNLVGARLASADQELDALRRTRDLLDQQLVGARREIGVLEEQLTEQTMRAINAEHDLHLALGITREEHDCG